MAADLASRPSGGFSRANAFSYSPPAEKAPAASNDRPGGGALRDTLYKFGDGGGGAGGGSSGGSGDKGGRSGGSDNPG